MTLILLAGAVNIFCALWNYRNASRNSAIAHTNLEVAKANLANSRKLITLLPAAGTESLNQPLPASTVTKE